MDIKDIKLGDILKPFLSASALADKGEGCVSPNHPALNGFVGTVGGFESGYARLLGDGYDTGILFSPTFLVKV